MPAYKSIASPRDETRLRRAGFIQRQFERFQDYWEPDMKRLIRNSRMYWGINFGQWPSYAVEKLRNQGRRPPTFNISAWKVETLCGSFLSNPFDIKYMPMIGKLDSLALKLQDMYYSDKYNLGWETPEQLALRDCFIQVGYERMMISDRFSDFGNCAWESPNPLCIFLDPAWKTSDINDIKCYFEEEMLFAYEIAEKFPHTSSYLKQLKEREEVEGVDYGQNTTNIPNYRETEHKWGDRHRVLGFHFTKEEVEDWEYDIKNHCNFPDTGFKNGSEQDREAKQRYIQQVGLDPNFDITWTKRKRVIKFYEAIVPTIDSELFLAKGKDKVQTNNCNIYPLGLKFHSQYQGVIDRLYDIQLSINRGEMYVDDIQARSAKGAFALDRALTGGDSQKELEIEQGWNDPAARIWLDEGSTKDLPNGGIIELPGASARPDLVNQIGRRYDLADRLSLVPAAMDARTESNQETGILYRHKVEMGLVGQKWYAKLWETHKREKALAYARQSKITYAGIPREFAGAGNSNGFVINERVVDSYGNTFVLDDISILPMMKVVLVPSTSGINLRTELRSNYAETLQVLTDPQDRLLRLIMTGAILETQEIPDEQKEEIRKAVGLLKMEAGYQTSINVLMLRNKLIGLGQAAQEEGQQSAMGGSGQEQIPQQFSAGSPSQAEIGAGTPQQEGDNMLQGGNFIEKMQTQPQEAAV